MLVKLKIDAINGARRQEAKERCKDVIASVFGEGLEGCTWRALAQERGLLSCTTSEQEFKDRISTARVGGDAVDHDDLNKPWRKVSDNYVASLATTS